MQTCAKSFRELFGGRNLRRCLAEARPNVRDRTVVSAADLAIEVTFTIFLQFFLMQLQVLQLVMAESCSAGQEPNPSELF
jgi:hypothetical protein